MYVFMCIKDFYKYVNEHSSKKRFNTLANQVEIRINNIYSYIATYRKT